LFERQPSELLLFALSALAAWRVTALIAYESGPFHVFDRLRHLLVRLRLTQLVTCFHCLALWISAFVVLAVYKLTWWSVLLWLAVAGAASIVERWLGGSMPTGGEEDGV
jgi:hypothetical protein